MLLFNTIHDLLRAFILVLIVCYSATCGILWLINTKIDKALNQSGTVTISVGPGGTVSQWQEAFNVGDAIIAAYPQVMLNYFQYGNIIDTSTVGGK